MTCGPFLKKILLFSVPLILTGLLQLAYNTADVIVVGRFVGKVTISFPFLLHLKVFGYRESTHAHG